MFVSVTSNNKRGKLNYRQEKGETQQTHRLFYLFYECICSYLMALHVAAQHTKCPEKTFVTVFSTETIPKLNFYFLFFFLSFYIFKETAWTFRSNNGVTLLGKTVLKSLEDEAHCVE